MAEVERALHQINSLFLIWSILLPAISVACGPTAAASPGLLVARSFLTDVGVRGELGEGGILW